MCELSHNFFFFQAEDGIRYDLVTGVQTCALPIRCPALASPVRWLDAKLRLVDELEADVTALARRRESTRGSTCARKRACRCRFSGRAEPRLQPRLSATFGCKGAPGATTPRSAHPLVG